MDTPLYNKQQICWRDLNPRSFGRMKGMFHNSAACLNKTCAPPAAMKAAGCGGAAAAPVNLSNNVVDSTIEGIVSEGSVAAAGADDASGANAIFTRISWPTLQRLACLVVVLATPFGHNLLFFYYEY